MPALPTAALIVFLEGLSFAVILPVIAAYSREMGADEMGGDEVWAGILFAAAAFPRVVVALMWGRLSDHVGRKPTMAMIATGTACASVLWALSPKLDGMLLPGLIWLLVSRLVYGLFAAQSVLAMAVASDVSTPAKRASALGMLGAAFGLAFAIGPAIGGAFSQAFGNANTGYLAAFFQALSLLAALFVLKETHKPSRGAAATHDDDAYVAPRTMMRLMHSPLVMNLGIVTLLSTAAYSVMFPTIEPFMLEGYRWTPLEVGYMLSAFGFVGALVQGGMIRPAVRRFGEKMVGLLGLSLIVAGMAWIAAAASLTSVFAAMATLAIGTGFAVPALSGMMSLSVTPRDQGAVHGLNQSATAAGRAAGFLLGGFLYGGLSAQTAYASAAAVAFLGLLLLWPTRFNPTEYSDEAVIDEVP